MRLHLLNRTRRIQLINDESSVRSYHVTTGHLNLEHNYPRQAGKDTSIAVDINPLLETITAEELRVGAWVNVLGYVRRHRQAEDQKYYVEAVMVFPAGAVALGEYERVVRDAQDVDLMRGT